MSEPSPFRPALVIGLITAGLISFAAFILLLGWGERRADPEQLTGSAPSVAATGFKGLVDLTGKFVDVEMVNGEADLDSYHLLVVALTAGDDPERVEALLRRRQAQSTLLILPKWAAVRDPERRNWVRVLGPWQSGAATRLMGPDYRVELLSAAPGISSAEGSGYLEGIAVPLPQSPQVIHGDEMETLIGIPAEGALVAQIGEEPHYVVADPDLLNNHGLRRPEVASAAVQMMARLMPDEEGMILFDTGVAAQAPPGRNLLRLMFEPPFLAMTIALLIAALLAGLHGAGRFGPARRPVRAIPFGKAALVENSAGLVRLARREVRLGTAYADLVRDEAARAGAAPPHLHGEALEAYLDRFTRPGEPPFGQLAADLRQAPDRAALLAAARALFRWKKDMIR